MDENINTTNEYHIRDIMTIEVTIDILMNIVDSFGKVDANKFVMNIAVLGLERLVVNPFHQF